MYVADILIWICFCVYETGTIIGGGVDASSTFKKNLKET